MTNQCLTHAQPPTPSPCPTQCLTNAINPTTDHWPNTVNPMSDHGSTIAGEARNLMFGEIGNCYKMVVIQISSPASPLHNNDSTVFFQFLVGARRVVTVTREVTVTSCSLGKQPDKPTSQVSLLGKQPDKVTSREQFLQSHKQSLVSTTKNTAKIVAPL
jgi:hypothetical protein